MRGSSRTEDIQVSAGREDLLARLKEGREIAKEISERTDASPSMYLRPTPSEPKRVAGRGKS